MQLCNTTQGWTEKGRICRRQVFFSSAQQFWKSSCCGLVESRPPNYFRINGSRLRYAIDYFVAIAHFGNHIWCSEMPLSSDQIVSLIVPNFFPLRPTTFLNFVIHSTPHEWFIMTCDWMLTTLALRTNRRPLWHMLAGRTSSVGECASDPIFLEFRLASWLNT